MKVNRVLTDEQILVKSTRQQKGILGGGGGDSISKGHRAGTNLASLSSSTIQRGMDFYKFSWNS